MGTDGDPDGRPLPSVERGHDLGWDADPVAVLPSSWIVARNRIARSMRRGTEPTGGGPELTDGGRGRDQLSA